MAVAGEFSRPDTEPWSDRSMSQDQVSPFEGRVKTLWIREPSLSHILAGRKTVEVRVGYDNIRRLQPGDRLKLNGRHLATIRRISHYADFETLVAAEDPAAIAPDLAGRSGQGLPSGRLLAALRDLYPPEKEALGAVALEIALCRYDAVLFDMGYTLIYFEPPQEVIIREALRTLGVERSVAEIEAAFRVVYADYDRAEETATFPATEEHDRQVQQGFGRALLAQLGLVTDEQAWRSYAGAMEAWFSRPGVIRPYPEVIEVLTGLKARGYRLGIISNWSWNLRERVAQVGLDGYFELIWASAYAGCNKPHPDIFRQALARMDLLPARTLYVGDSYRHDVIGARNAGLDAALLDRNGTADSPDCPVIRDLWGVFDLLR